MVELNEEEWNSLYKSFPDSIILDVRTLGEYNSEYIENSTHIDIQIPDQTKTQYH